MKNVTFVKCGAVVLFVTALFTFVSSGKTKSADLKSAQSLVEDIPTIQSFLDEPVPEDDLQKIVNAGINSQSAMNGQPWHFSVVTSKTVMDDISSKMKSSMQKMEVNLILA